MGKAGRGRERKIARGDDLGSLQEHLAGREVEPRRTHIAAGSSREVHRHLPIPACERVLLDHDRIGSLGDRSAGEDAHRLPGAELTFEGVACRAHADEGELCGRLGNIGGSHRVSIHRRCRKGRLVSRGDEAFSERAAVGLAERHALRRQGFLRGRKNARERLGDGQKRVLFHRRLHITLCSCVWTAPASGAVHPSFPQKVGLQPSDPARKQSQHRELGRSRPRSASRKAVPAAISRSQPRQRGKRRTRECVTLSWPAAWPP